MEATADRRGSVLIVGDVIDDVIVRPLEPVRRGTDTSARISASPGGSGANQAVWLAAHGATVRFVGRVGSQDVERHRELFVAAGVEPHLVGDRQLPTGRIVILVDPGDGERTMYTDRGANLALQRQDLPDALLDEVGWLHLSGYSLFEPSVREAVLDLVERARRRAIPLSVDPASTAFLTAVGVPTFLSWLAGVTTLFPNLDEGRLLTGAQDPYQVVHELLTHVEEVVLKLGADGALYAVRGGRPVHLPAVAVDVVDTTGAGDAFCGAFLAARMAGRDAGDALAAAIAAGARAAGVAGARPG